MSVAILLLLYNIISLLLVYYTSCIASYMYYNGDWNEDYEFRGSIVVSLCIALLVDSATISAVLAMFSEGLVSR